MNGDLYMERVTTFLPPKMKRLIFAKAAELKIPISRVVAIAVDNELMKDKPFGDWSTVLPDDEMVEFAYAQEASQILEFITVNGKMGLDMLMICREEFNIKDRKTFLLAFRELVDKRMIEGHRPTNQRSVSTYDDDYLLWDLAKDLKPMKARLAKKRASDYEVYLKLKKRFKDM